MLLETIKSPAIVIMVKKIRDDFWGTTIIGIAIGRIEKIKKMMKWQAFLGRVKKRQGLAQRRINISLNSTRIVTYLLFAVKMSTTACVSTPLSCSPTTHQHPNSRHIQDLPRNHVAKSRLIKHRQSIVSWRASGCVPEGYGASSREG